MKITSISDTHGLHDKVKIEPCDILLFGGDFMTCGYKEIEVFDFLEWFSEQPAKHKVMIAGNHCRYVENYPKEFRDILKNYPTITYLEDEFTIVEGLKIYGTPHSKVFYNWAFNRIETQLEALFDKIPTDIDILLSHAPQYGVLDTLVDGRSVGENTLSKAISRCKNLKLHVFGHIHNSHGLVKPHGKHISINASQVNEYYEISGFPITVEL